MTGGWNVTNVIPQPSFFAMIFQVRITTTFLPTKKVEVIIAILLPNQEFAQLASEEQIANTVQALETNGIRTLVVETGEEARSRVLEAS